MAIRYGLRSYTGGCAAIFMADASDSPQDLVSYFRLIQEGYDCAFGSRFIKGGKVVRPVSPLCTATFAIATI